MKPDVTVVIPSFNQGRFLELALESVFEQSVAMEVFVIDGGSSDNSIDIIKQWAPKLSGWQSKPDKGQADAINQGVARGTAPFVCWLNSDDILLPGGLEALLAALQRNPAAPVAYGDCWHITEEGKKKLRYLTLPFSKRLLANYCFIAQPATLIRRDAWEAVGGLDVAYHMAMDYDLWWKLFHYAGRFERVRVDCAANRLHSETKTYNRLDDHYRESIDIVKEYYGSVPLKWYALKQVMRAVRAIEGRSYKKVK